MQLSLGFLRDQIIGGPLQLLIIGQHPTCLEDKDSWQNVCNQNGLLLEIIELDDEQGQALIDKLELKSFPVLIADSKVKAVGRPDSQIAQDIICKLASGN